MRRHRLIMSGLMMRVQIGVQKSTGKIRGNWGCQKGVFLGTGKTAGKGQGRSSSCKCMGRSANFGSVVVLVVYTISSLQDYFGLWLQLFIEIQFY